MSMTDNIYNIVDEINNLLNKLPSNIPLEVVDESGNEANLNVESFKYEPNENIIRVWCETT